MIKSNAHRYSVSAQCCCLGVARATYYRNRNARTKPDKDAKLSKLIEDVYTANRCVFGSRKIKHVLQQKHGVIASVRRIRRCMNALGLESVYKRKKYRAMKDSCNNADIPNLIDREFNGRAPYEAIVSDLTYIRVAGRWHYACILLDLHNREIAGYSAGTRKDASLVRKAFAKINTNLTNIHIFHSDRGSEFDNATVDEMLEAFGIARSLSMKACPYDNAVAESTFKMIKAEFVYRMNFDSLEHLERELDDYVNWFNTRRPHSTLGYMTPSEYRDAMSKGSTEKFILNRDQAHPHKLM